MLIFSPRPVHWRPVPHLLLGALLLAGCARQSSAPTLQVFAASSFTDAFQALETAFEIDHPGADVVLSFAGSQVLRLQIELGAGADVFASANAHHMQTLIDQGRVHDSRIFARNALTLITPLDNPADIQQFKDLPRARRLLVGTEAVPVGSYTAEVLRRSAAVLGHAFAAEVRARVVSRESNVRLIRAKVALGEADAAIVYRTDAAATDRVREVPIPPALNVAADCLIGRVEGGALPALADRWTGFVGGNAGQRILAQHGFVVDR